MMIIGFMKSPLLKRVLSTNNFWSFALAFFESNPLCSFKNFWSFTTSQYRDVKGMCKHLDDINSKHSCDIKINANTEFDFQYLSF